MTWNCTALQWQLPECVTSGASWDSAELAIIADALQLASCGIVRKMPIVRPLSRRTPDIAVLVLSINQLIDRGSKKLQLRAREI